MSQLWPYPALENRVFLDYPLDILLNRECSLNSHEAGLVDLLEDYEEAAGEFERQYPDDAAKLRALLEPPSVPTLMRQFSRS